MKACPGDNPIKPRERDFLLGVIRLFRRQPLLLRLQLHLASRHVNFGAEARRETIRRLLENRLGAIHLHFRRIDARRFGKHLQICRGHHVDHDFPRVRRGKLGRSLRFARGLVGADRLQIGDALRQVAAQIEIVERPHDLRKMDSQARRKC